MEGEGGGSVVQEELGREETDTERWGTVEGHGMSSGEGSRGPGRSGAGSSTPAQRTKRLTSARFR